MHIGKNRASFESTGFFCSLLCLKTSESRWIGSSNHCPPHKANTGVDKVALQLWHETWSLFLYYNLLIIILFVQYYKYKCTFAHPCSYYTFVAVILITVLLEITMYPSSMVLVNLKMIWWKEPRKLKTLSFHFCILGYIFLFTWTSRSVLLG